jgi:hypothetical protein
VGNNRFLPGHPLEALMGGRDRMNAGAGQFLDFVDRAYVQPKVAAVKTALKPLIDAGAQALERGGEGNLYAGKPYRGGATKAAAVVTGPQQTRAATRPLPPSLSKPSAADVFGNLADGKDVVTAGIKSALAATGGSKDTVKAADNTLGRAGKVLNLLSEGYRAKDEVSAGRDPDVAAVRSAARIGTVALGENFGQGAGGSVGMLAGGGAGALEGGAPAVPGAIVGGLAGRAIGGLLGGYFTEKSPLDDWAADGAERVYVTGRGVARRLMSQP